MATSGTYSFGVTRDDIIRQAMLNIRRLAANRVPTASETNDCSRVLNMMCKQWMGKSDFAPGLKVWTRKRGYLILDDTNTYHLGSGQDLWTSEIILQTTLASSAAAASDTIILSEVLASGYPATNDTIAIALDSGSIFVTTVASRTSTTVTLGSVLPSAASAGNAVFDYSAAAQNPMLVETALLRDIDGTDTPLRIFRDVASYDALPNKVDPDNVGDPSAIYLERGLDYTTLYLDVAAAQDLSKYLVLTYQEPVQDFTTTADAPYFPQEWYLALCWGLSEQICPMFGATWDQKMEQLKMNALAIARNSGAEISELYFQPGAED